VAVLFRAATRGLWHHPHPFRRIHGGIAMPVNPRASVSRVKSTIVGFIWGVDTETLPRWKAGLIGFVRVLYGVGGSLAEGQLNLRAMSLVYTTLLSIVPLLAICFSVLKGFGVHNELEPMLLSALAPLGEKGAEIAGRIIEFVEKVKAGVLGSMGLGLLVYTVISLMQKIERAFNYTWRITQERSLAQRFSDYLSVIVIGPVLVFSALGITGSVMSTTVVTSITAIEPFGFLIGLAGKVVPYILIVAAFTFVYSFMPNTKVKLASAVVGALIAGIMWETAGWAFASFVVNSTKYTAIYSAFATLIVFMIWLYLSWLILLIGATISFYHQNPDYLITQQRGHGMSNRIKEKLALTAGALIVGNLYDRQEAWTLDELSRRLGVPSGNVETVMSALEAGGLFKRTGDNPAAFLPARAVDTTQVGELLDAVRSAEEQSHLDYEGLRADAGVATVVERLEQATSQALEGITLKDLVPAETQAPPRIANPGS
jgi:membrane protein